MFLTARFPRRYYVHSNWFVFFVRLVRLYELCYITQCCFTIYATCPKVPPNPSNIRPSSLHYRHMGVPLTILYYVQKISIQHVLVPRNQCNHGNLSFYFTVDISTFFTLFKKIRNNGKKRNSKHIIIGVLYT